MGNDVLWSVRREKLALHQSFSVPWSWWWLGGGGSLPRQAARVGATYDSQGAVHRTQTYCPPLCPKNCAGIEEKPSQIPTFWKLRMMLGIQDLTLKRVGYEWCQWRERRCGKEDETANMYLKECGVRIHCL